MIRYAPNFFSRGELKERRYFEHVTQMFCAGQPLGECLAKVREMPWPARQAFFRLSADAADLYDPVFVATCDKSEEKLLRRGLACMDPVNGMAVLRRLLDGAEMLPRPTLLGFASLPFLEPRLILETTDKKTPHPADAASAFVWRALSSFGLKPSPLRNTWRPEKDGVISRTIGRNYHDLLPLVQNDATASIQILMDINLRKPTRSFLSMLYLEGGPECLKMLLRPETYAGSGIRREALAALAVMAQKGDEAVAVLEGLEAETPGLVKAQKDAAGRNLLWYLALRERIWIHASKNKVPWEPSIRPGDAARVRDVLLAAGCDPNATDVFGFSWEEARECWRHNDLDL